MSLAAHPSIAGPRAFLYLLPREHGAYVQLLVPLAAAFAAGSHTVAATVVAGAGIGAFASHESFLVVMGHRGIAAFAAMGGRARGALAGLLALSLAGLLIGLVLVPQVSAPLLVPGILGAVVLRLAWHRRERSLPGEVLASTALASWSLPVAVAGGLTWAGAATLCWTFVAAFALLVVAVRGLLGGARRQAARRWLRLGASLGAMVVPALEWLAIQQGMFPAWGLAALAPLCLLVLGLAVVGPRPTHLRTVGWVSSVASLWMLGIAVWQAGS